MAQLGIMIEAQEGLTWSRWNDLIVAADTLGFESIWRSDHLFSLMGDAGRDALALWPSLTLVATRSQRLRFGPLVCPITFRNPVLLARSATAIDQLSGGRFALGLGAGWNRREHDAFGFRFPPMPQRLGMLEEAIKVIRLLWTGERVSFEGRYFQLHDAMMHPTPVKPGGLPIIIGGSGKERLLEIIARNADEWNVHGISRAQFDFKWRTVARLATEANRDPESIRRSLMVPYLIGFNQEERIQRAERLQQIIPALREIPAADVPDRLRERGWLVGNAEEIAAGIRTWEAAGIERFMLQTFDQQDLGALELLAQEVMPRVSIPVG